MYIVQNNDLFLIVSPLCFDTTADTVDGFNPAFSFLFFNDISFKTEKACC